MRYGFTPFAWGFGVSMGSFAAHIVQGLIVGVLMIIGYGIFCIVEACTKK